MRDYGFSAAQQDEIWRRWRQGESFSLVGLPTAGALVQQRQKDRARSGWAASASPSRPGDALPLRFLAGRDLRSRDPSSSASWWRAGEMVVRDRTAADLASADPYAPKTAQHGMLRTIAAGAGRWSCWPGAARTTVRLAVLVVVMALWRGWGLAAAVVLGVLPWGRWRRQ